VALRSRGRSARRLPAQRAPAPKASVKGKRKKVKGKSDKDEINAITSYKSVKVVSA